MPRVSVVMPAHNAAPFLPAALSSVQAQTFTDWEVVAVDDGSSDETWSILENAGPRVRALRTPQSEGPAAARNRATVCSATAGLPGTAYAISPSALAASTSVSTISAYTASRFDAADHLRLQQVVVELAKRGCYVLVSNSTAAEIGV